MRKRVSSSILNPKISHHRESINEKLRTNKDPLVLFPEEMKILTFLLLKFYAEKLHKSENKRANNGTPPEVFLLRYSGNFQVCHLSTRRILTEKIALGRHFEL